jgi:osmotically-inducible protein OsmY
MAQCDRDSPSRYRDEHGDGRVRDHGWERGQESNERRWRAREEGERYSGEFERPASDSREDQQRRRSDHASEYEHGRQRATQRDFRREPHGGGYERAAEYGSTAQRGEHGGEVNYGHGGGSYDGRAPYGGQWPFGARGGYGNQGSYGGQGPYGNNYGWASQAGQQGRMRRGPKGYTRSDERLKEDIAERLMYAWDVDASDVSLEVQNGKVMLEGTVPERRMKHAIEDIVDNCPGVQDIDNRVRVARSDPGMQGDEGSRGSSAPLKSTNE